MQSLREQLMMTHRLYGKSDNLCSKCGKEISDTPNSSSVSTCGRETDDNAYGNQTESGNRIFNANIQLKTPELPDFKKMFEKNETMMDLMTEDLMSLKEVMSAQNKLGLFERILLSAKMVKNVLMRNMELNKDYMDHTLKIDELQKQIGQLQLENEDIRDRLSIMEALTGTDSYYVSMNYSSIKDEFSGEADKKSKKEMLSMLDQDKMIALIYEYNKENTILKKRIERFEKSKIKNKFMQISDGMSSTGYINNRQSTELESGEQMFALGYR